MNTGVEEVKPDRMLERFVTNSLHGRRVPSDQAALLVTAAAQQLRVSASTLDHAI